MDHNKKQGNMLAVPITSNHLMCTLSVYFKRQAELQDKTTSNLEIENTFRRSHLIF